MFISLRCCFWQYHYGQAGRQNNFLKIWIIWDHLKPPFKELSLGLFPFSCFVYSFSVFPLPGSKNWTVTILSPCQGDYNLPMIRSLHSSQEPGWLHRSVPSSEVGKHKLLPDFLLGSNWFGWWTWYHPASRIHCESISMFLRMSFPLSQFLWKEEVRFSRMSCTPQFSMDVKI
jgi:hypothetical protein